MDCKLFDLLCLFDMCQFLFLFDVKVFDVFNCVIGVGGVVKVDGSFQIQFLCEVLLMCDCKQVFCVDDGILVLLVEEVIEMVQIVDFLEK